MVKEKMPSFIATHLDPANRFIEVVCGLIMVLTFTLVGSQLVSDDPSGAQKLLIAALGCNVAWGVIDGVMFVMNGLTERGRRARFVAAVRDATDEAAALSVIERDLDPELEGITTSEERGTLYRSIRKIALRAAPQAVRNTSPRPLSARQRTLTAISPCACQRFDHYEISSPIGGLHCEGLCCIAVRAPTRSGGWLVFVTTKHNKPTRSLAVPRMGITERRPQCRD